MSNYSNFCNCPINLKEAELSNPNLQNVYSGNSLNLGSAVIGGNGPNIVFTGGDLFLSPGLYLVSYSTSAVWTTTPYGTNEAIIGLTLRNMLLTDSVSTAQIPPQIEDVGLVPFKLNLSKTILVRVTLKNSILKLVNESTEVMGFEHTVLTIVKLS